MIKHYEFENNLLSSQLQNRGFTQAKALKQTLAYKIIYESLSVNFNETSKLLHEERSQNDIRFNIFIILNFDKQIKE